MVYPKSEMKKHLNASRYRVDMALEELEKCGQMVVVTQPDLNCGITCWVYVEKYIHRKFLKEMLEERKEADKFILVIDTWFEKFLGA